MDKAVEVLRDLSSASVSDAMDKLGLHGTAQGIRALATGHHVAGRAFTLKYIPVEHGYHNLQRG